VLDAEGRTQAREVEVGVSNRIQAQIVSGLAEGERLLSVHLRDGAAAAGQGGITRLPRLR
jgi:macrolide-specific efflux system membrane fusion protein